MDTAKCTPPLGLIGILRLAGYFASPNITEFYCNQSQR